jgi:hypothetical protein
MNNLDNLKRLIEELEVDAEKFYNKQNRTASVRARKILQEIKSEAQNMRMDISRKRNENE